jgi:Ca2+-binding EF-hand superfamily protein
MKTSSVSLFLLTAGLLAVPAAAQKEMKAAPAMEGSLKQNYKEYIKKWDLNGDGRLDEDEKAAAHAEMRKEGAGPDGERWKQILKRFDKDGDGKLNAAERAEAEKAREMLQRNGGMEKYRALVLKRFDHDGDGRLNPAEQAEADKFRAEMAKKFDKNGDGKLDDEEREEALKAFMAETPAATAPKKDATPASGK